MINSKDLRELIFKPKPTHMSTFNLRSDLRSAQRLERGRSVIRMAQTQSAYFIKRVEKEKKYREVDKEVILKLNVERKIRKKVLMDDLAVRMERAEQQKNAIK
jgi:hypothetical protein